MLSNKNLNKLVKSIAKRDFGVNCDAKIEYDSRLRTTGGRYSRKENLIQMNPKMLTVYGNVIFIGTIKHELCHYVLVHLKHRIGRYQGHDSKFYDLLDKVNGLRWAPNPYQALWIYQCVHCHKVYYMDKPASVNGVEYSVCLCGYHLKLIYKNKLADKESAAFRNNPLMAAILA